LAAVQSQAILSPLSIQNPTNQSMKNSKWQRYLRVTLGAVCIGSFVSPSNATILTFSTDNAKVKVYTTMDAIQDYGSNVVVDSVVSGAYTYYYEMGNGWTPDVTVRYSTESPTDFPEYYGNSDGDNVWPGVLFLWSHIFTGGTAIPSSIPTGYEYYVTFTPSAANTGVVINSFVLNDYVGYTAPGSPPQEVQWRVAKGSPSGALVASGSATLQDGEVSTISTGMSAAQASLQPLVLVIKRMGGTEDDLAVDDINFDQTEIIPPTVYNNAVRASNPKYYWTFDEAGLGNAREQMSGNAADVFTPSGASAKAPSTTTTGNVSLGQALALDRTASSVWNTGDLSGPAFTGAFAYEVWINSADPDQYNYILGSNAGNGFNTASILQFSNFAPDAGTAHIFVYPAWPGDTSTALQAAGWNHWVFVSKPNGGGSDVYKNGAFLGPFQEGLTINAFPATELRAGGWSPSASVENFTGQIDELAIYDLGSLDAVALAAKGQEIAKHYHAVAGVPSIGTQPRNETASPGSHVTFTVVASGGLLTYQWQKFGGGTWENIAGSTSASLVFNAVTSANSGQYRVQITNAAGSADSQSVTLDIVSPPTVYNNAVRASNPKYYWTFDEAGLGNAREQMSGNAADVFTPSGDSAKAPSTTTTGNVSLGQALALDRTASSVWNTGDLSGPAFTGAFAYEVWINSADPDQYNYILGSNAGNGFNTGTIAQSSTFADDPGTPHIMLFTLSHPPHSFNFDSALQSSGWHHWVFVTKTPEQGTDVYKNGVLLGTYANGSVIAPFPATELRAGGWSSSPSAENFTGQIDELAIYDLGSLDAVALAAKGQEIASHYQVGNAAPSLECTHVLRDPTNGQLTLTWTSQPGKTYRLNSSTNLVDFTTVIADNIPSGGASTTYGPFAGPVPTGFFRVREN
jgi:hypothetical protein